jgi:hypothetical protein
MIALKSFAHRLRRTACVCADESDIHNLAWVVDPNDYSILVSTDVEDRATILKNAGVAELRFHVAGL